MSVNPALIGAGAMGGAIGARLLETSNSLAVFDLDEEKVAALVQKGARAATSAADAADGARNGAIIIDMSSIDSVATRELAQMARDSGLRWVDSPLSGGAPKALTGELTLMAGGEAEDVETGHKLLRHVASGAPEFPLILAVSYPDLATMTAALDSPARHQSRAVTGEITGEFFNRRIHHHVTQANIHA